MRQGGRSKLLWIIVIFCFVLVLCLVFSGSAKASELLQVELVSVYDGDTIKVNFKGCSHFRCQGVLVRFAGVDAPEVRTPCMREKEVALKLKETIQDLLLAADTISLSLVKGAVDPYGRVLAKVYADGLDVSQMLLDSGMVRENHGEKRRAWCDSAGEVKT